MNEQYNQKLSANAKKLRSSMTKEERRLWYDCLKSLPMTVHRQKVLGNYIVDFYIASVKIMIELDGSQHYEQAHMEKDAQRDAYLKGLGIRVLRYANSDINYRFRAVCEDIYNNIEDAYHFAETTK